MQMNLELILHFILESGSYLVVLKGSLMNISKKGVSNQEPTQSQMQLGGNKESREISRAEFDVAEGVSKWFNLTGDWVSEKDAISIQLIKIFSNARQRLSWD